MHAIVESLSVDAPSGENLEYEPVFTELVLAARVGEERQAGDEVIAADEPDPAAVVARAEAVLARSHDLRAAVLLGYGALRLGGLAGLARGTALVRGHLERFWETCHPQLDAEDDDDPTMRVNAVLDLARPDTILRGVRLAPLTDSPAFGRLSLRDLAVAAGEAAPPPGMEAPPDAATVAAAFKDTPPERLAEILDGARAVLADVEAIDAVFDRRLPGRGPNLSSLRALLDRAVARLAEEVGVPVPAAAAEGAAPNGADPAPPAPARREGIGSLRDVERAIDEIVAWYAEHEPSSPVPILLSRARRLVGADFMTIVADLAPGGADSVKHIGGLE